MSHGLLEVNAGADYLHAMAYDASGGLTGNRNERKDQRGNSV